MATAAAAASYTCHAATINACRVGMAAATAAEPAVACLAGYLSQSE